MPGLQHLVRSDRSGSLLSELRRADRCGRPFRSRSAFNSTATLFPGNDISNVSVEPAHPRGVSSRDDEDLLRRARD